MICWGKSWLRCRKKTKKTNLKIAGVEGTRESRNISLRMLCVTSISSPSRGTLLCQPSDPTIRMTLTPGWPYLKGIKILKRAYDPLRTSTWRSREQNTKARTRERFVCFVIKRFYDQHNCLRNSQGAQRFVVFFFLAVIVGCWLAEQTNSFWW